MLRIPVVVMAVIVMAVAAEAKPDFDDNPRSAKEWGFRPQDGREIRINPPGFSWRPQKGAKSYVLQAARDDDFAEVVYEAEGIVFSVHCPPEVLPVGSLCWRVAFVTEEGERSAWSTTRRFTMPAGVNEFPMPARDDLMGRVPGEHPRLFLRPEDLPRLRELAQGPLKDRYDALVAECEKLLVDPPPTEEPQKYPEDIKRGSDPWRTIWWGNRTYTTKVLNGAATLAFTRLLGGPDEFGEQARTLLMAAAQWDPKGATGYRYNDEAGMPYAYYFSRTYTFVHDLLTEEEREKCREVMRIRGDEMYRHLCPRHLWTPYSSHSNRAWHFLGEVGIAFLGEIPEAEDWLWFASNVFFNVYPVWCDEDGGWHEGSAYWAGYLSRVTWWLDVQRAAFGLDGYKKPFFSQAGYFPIYLMPPNCPRGGFGDLTGHRKPEHNVALVSVFAAQAQDPYWQGYVEELGGPSQAGGYVGFMRGALPPVESKPLADLVSSRLFEGTGLALLHTDLTESLNDVQIEFKSSPFGSQSHGYESQNAFLLYAYGEPLLIRTGRRDSYGSSHHRDWMWSTRSVNSITVNGQSQFPRSANALGEITQFQTSEEYDYAVGDASKAYPEGLVKRFVRHLLFVKPDLVVVLDDLETPEPATFQYWLHAVSEMRIGGQHDIEVSEGAAGCKINFLAPSGLKVSQTDQFDPPPRPRIKLTQYHLTAETTEPAERLQFVTLIWPYRKGSGVPGTAQLERTEGGYALSADLAEGKAIILWRTDEGDLSGYDLATDADMAALRLDAQGRPVDCFVSGGEQLRFSGERFEG